MIQINDLEFSYKKKQKLFQGLNLELPPGSIIGLLGKNGAGKTSLLKLMAGLLYPKQGNCSVFGKESQLRLPSMHLPKREIVRRISGLPNPKLSYHFTWSLYIPCKKKPINPLFVASLVPTCKYRF